MNKDHKTLKKDDSLEFSVETGPTHLEPEQTEFHSQEALEQQTVDLPETQEREKETARAKTAMEGDTIDHTPPPADPDVTIDSVPGTIAKGVVPTDIEISEETQGVPTVASKSGRKSQSSFKSLVGSMVGDYRIDSELGRGGMGVVYKAHHTKLRRDVAIKMILGAAAKDMAARERFETEARAVATLKHNNVVQLYEVGEFEGSPFIALEFVEGGTFVELTKENALDPKHAAQLIEQLARAMHEAHEQGVLHRDLKPANVLLSTDGVPKITDFGLAKELIDQSQTETATGTVMGTPSFMSPEQAQGHVRELTGATDQYSLGAVLYALISGRPPFMSSTTIETISQVVNKEPVPLRQLSGSVPVDLETICLKSLEKDTDKRYENCHEFAEDLRRFVLDEPIRARPISALQKGLRWCKRNPRIAIPSGLAGLFFVAAAIISTWSWAAISAQAAIIADERDEANDQRVLAQEAQVQAEKNEELAERQAILALENIQLIVTEVDDKLASEPGMSDLRIGIMEVLEKKWDELDLKMTGGIEGQAIPTLMAVRSKIANAWKSLGKLEKADAVFAKLYDQGHDRLRIKNRNDASRYNLATIATNWANVHEQVTNDPTETEKLRDEAIALLEDIIANPLPAKPGEGPGPNNVQVSAVLVDAYMIKANAAREFGDVVALREAMGKIDDTSAAILLEVEQGEADWIEPMRKQDKLPRITAYFKQNRTMALMAQALALYSLNKTEEGSQLFQEAIARAQAGVKAAPQDLNAKDQLMRMLGAYGKSLLKAGQIEAGTQQLALAHREAETTYESDPENADYKKSYGSSLYYLATAREAMGQADDALALFERSRVIRAELFENSQDKSNKVNLMLTLARLGSEEEALPLIDALAALDTKDPDLRLDLARSLAQLSEDSADKDALVARALDELERCVADGHMDPFPIKNELDLIPIQKEARFQTLVAELEQRFASNLEQ